MSYKIFELVKGKTLYHDESDGNCYLIKDLNEVYENKEDAVEKIKRFKQRSFSSFIILEVY